jgi:hypothetical protein
LQDWTRTYYQAWALMIIVTLTVFAYTLLDLGILRFSHRITRPALILLVIMPVVCYIVVTTNSKVDNTKLGQLRVFRQDFALEDAIEFHAFALLEAILHVCVANSIPLGWQLPLTVRTFL